VHLPVSTLGWCLQWVIVWLVRIRQCIGNYLLACLLCMKKSKQAVTVSALLALCLVHLAVHFIGSTVEGSTIDLVGVCNGYCSVGA
jgi:hypothetical protein